MKLDEIDEAILIKKEKPFKEVEHEFKKVEEIVDDAMIEGIENMSEQVTNNEICVEALRNRKVMYNVKDGINDLDKQYGKINNTLTSFLRKTWKLMVIIFLVALLNGYFLAVFQHDNIKPFLADIAKEVIKKAVHVSGD